MVSLAEMASVLAFIVTVALLLADAHQSSSQLSASAAELRSLHELNANLQSDFDERITDARRDLKLSDATCRTACLNSKRIAGKAHLRDKVKMQTCFGQERTSTCCLCLQDGYSLEDADAVPETESSDAGSDVVKRLEDQLAVAQQAIAENYERAAFDKVALDDAKEKLYAAQQEMTKLKEQASSGSVRTAVDVEVDDLDPATYKIDCHPPVPKQVFYNRIGKAGSTSVMMAAKNAARPNGYKVKELITSEYLTQEGNLEVMQKYVGAGLGCVTGSCEKVVFIGHVFFMDLGDFIPSGKYTRPAYVNFLRDPLERYISQYYFWRTLGDIGPSTSKVGKSLEECTEQSHLYGCPPLNYMTSYMCGGDATICSDPPDEQTFLRAKRNLITQYGMVGLTEQMDRSLKLLATMYPSFFKTSLRAGVVNKNSRGKKSVSETVKQKVEEANSYDRRLYNVAKELLERRFAECGV